MLQSQLYIQKAHRGSHDKVALVRILSQASTTRSLHISHQVSLPIDLKGTLGSQMLPSQGYPYPFSRGGPPQNATYI